jgi:AraC-like DNA-binding protein
LAYLTWWRMTAAARLLRETDGPLSAVARRCGYASQFAFAKAFKREFAVTPGAFRRASTRSLIQSVTARSRNPSNYCGAWRARP